MRKKALLVTCVVAAAMVLPVSTASALDDVNTQRLRNAVTVNNILNHERALDRIADRNGGTSGGRTVSETVGCQEESVPIPCRSAHTPNACRSKYSRMTCTGLIAG